MIYWYIFDCCTSSISPVYQVDIDWQWLVQPPFHHCPQDSCTSHRNAGNGFSVGTASGPKEIWASFCVHDGISRSPWEVMGRLELTSCGCWESEANGLNYIPWEDDIFSLERLSGFHPTTCIKQKLPVFKQGILDYFGISSLPAGYSPLVLRWLTRSVWPVGTWKTSP